MDISENFIIYRHLAPATDDKISLDTSRSKSIICKINELTIALVLPTKVTSAKEKNFTAPINNQQIEASCTILKQRQLQIMLKLAVSFSRV